MINGRSTAVERVILGAFCLLLSISARAHHGNAGYDMRKMTVIQKATIILRT
jgi:hypothetical protein